MTETYGTLRLHGTGILAAAGVPDAAYDAQQLLEKACRMDRSSFELRRTEPAQEEEIKEFEELCRLRASRIPLQHLLGEAWFMGLPFEVSPAVLIPRADTECLAEAVLERVPGKGRGMRLLDLCTGSGCIGISLAVLGQFEQVTLSDISPEALRVARRNGEKNGAAARLRLAQGDLLNACTEDGKVLRQEKFDAVCSNPPYIPSRVIDGLIPEVRDHDPRLALDGGPDGLDFYRRIASGAAEVLRPGGWLFLEIGEEQGAAVTELLAGCFEQTEVLRDLAGLDRVVSARRKE